LTFFPETKSEHHTGHDEPMTNRAMHTVPIADSHVRCQERPQVDIIGRAVALGPLDMDLMPQYQLWADEHREACEFAEMLSERELIVDDLADEFGDMGEDVYFTVYELGTWRPIGGAALTEIDFDDEAAEFSIVIGESECRDMGYGTESIRLVLDYAFNALGLRNVMLRVSEFNYSARVAFESAGFREFSRRKSCRLEGSRLWDEIYMGCLSVDFDSSMNNSPVLGEQLQA
jgi:RimJ/RimL family protein N-acetyltransferase